MNLRKIIQRRIRHHAPGVDVVGDVNAVISANVGERSGSTHVSSRQRIVQKSSGHASASRADEAKDDQEEA